jgi:hypothetical protein
MSGLQGIVWFENGEPSEIWHKLTVLKFAYETTWEASFLMPLALLIPLGFAESAWFGVFCLWVCKTAVQALNKMRFFDPLRQFLVGLQLQCSDVHEKLKRRLSEVARRIWTAA